MLKGRQYGSAEHFMMAEKARLFDDAETLQKILSAGGAQQSKYLGRTVRGFDEATWAANREAIVYQGNYAKFTQNPLLRTVLLSTKNAILAEASPHDRIWGIGLEANNTAAKNPLLWKGQNLLGFTLMRVREELR